MAFINTLVSKMGGTFTEAQKRSESILGLVVREESIQLAQMVRTSKGHKLQQLVYWSVNVPDKSTDPILEQPDYYARQIKQALDLAGVKGASVALVLPSQYLTLVNATIPQFSMPEMDDMDAEFFADFLPESFAEIDQYQLAWQVQKQIHDHGEMDVLFGLIKKEVLESFLEITRMSGLMPVLVSVDSLATANLFHQQVQYDGDWRGHINIANRGNSSILLSNGSDSQIYNFTLDEADTILLKQVESMGKVEGPFWAELGERMVHKINPIVAEFEQRESAKVSSYTLMSSSVASQKLAQLLAAQLGDLVLVNAMHNIEVPVSSRKYADAVDNNSFFAPVIGAATQRMNAFYQQQQLGFQLNFSPYASKLQKRARFGLFNMIMFIALGVAFVGVIAAFGTQDIPEYLIQQQQLDDYHQINSQVDNETTLVGQLNGQLQQRQQQLKYVLQLSGNAANYQTMLTELNKIVIPGASLKSIDFNGSLVTLQAKSGSLADASAFVDRVKKMPQAQSVTFSSYQAGDYSVSFTLGSGS